MIRYADIANHISAVKSPPAPLLFGVSLGGDSGGHLPHGLIEQRLQVFGASLGKFFSEECRAGAD
jgi:hypothetical protein